MGCGISNRLQCSPTTCVAVILTVQNLRKKFEGPTPVLDGVGFQCGEGTICAIVGPSGCGKTTLLRIINGILPQDSGTMELRAAAYEMGFMFQEDALLPWRTLFDNARLPLEVHNKLTAERLAGITKLFSEFGLADAAERYPGKCSIGMRQRAALVRTLAVEPCILLLDEPFSSLDYDVKLRVQVNLARYVERLNATILLVTHDIEDAIAMADKVIVMSMKPGTIKAEIQIELGLKNRDPIAARTSPKFREYFESIWQHLKYLPSPC